jgi:ferrous iron transport protein B
MLGDEVDLLTANSRYGFINGVVRQSLQRPLRGGLTLTDRVDNIVTHKWLGLPVFFAVMYVVFRLVIDVSSPFLDWTDAVINGPIANWLSFLLGLVRAPLWIHSLLIEGIVAGVGGVLVFLPQILTLFFFIAVLEDCGYMARAAYLMDKLMSRVGLSGKSFIPLLSSFACAIPGIMGARVIENRRDRLVTILIAPLMSCSARLPVYILLTAAFVPATQYLGGWITLQGLVLFAMSSLGLVVAIPTAWALRRTFFRGEASAFVMELPEYKVPSVRLVLHRVYDRSTAFITRAGTLIFATTILVWAAGYFPGDRSQLERIDSELAALEDAPEDDGRVAETERLRARRNEASAELIRESVLGRAGRVLEPAVRPLGWDWRIGVGVIASFPAREVIIGTLGTIYSLGGEVTEESPGLREAIQESKWPDGRPVCNLPVALSIMVFFALCAQCASTLMIIRRETNSWRWPAFCFGYMTGLAYLGALLTYQVGMLVAA